MAASESRIITSPRRGFRSIVVTLSVCVSVCPANILVFYFSAIRRDIDLKFIQDTYRVVLKSHKMTFIVKGQGHRDGTLLFEGTGISQKLSHRNFFHRHLLDTLFDETTKT